MSNCRARMQTIERYDVVFADREAGGASVAKWRDGELVWKKTDREVILFGVKNNEVARFLHYDIPEPRIEGGEKPSAEERVKDVSALPKASLPNDYTFLLKGRYEVRIERSTSVICKPYKPAGNRDDPHKAAVRKAIRRHIDAQDDILAGNDASV